MQETKHSIIAAIALSFALALPVAAQQSEADEPAQTETQPAPSAADTLSLGEEVGAEPFDIEVFGDWEKRCVAEADQQNCTLFQLLQDDQGNNVAEISLFGLPPGQQAAAGATIVTPLETLLTQQITLQVDAGQARRYPFSWCSQIGCFARVGFTDAEVEAFKRGVRALMTIVPAAAPDQEVQLTISLLGFTAGFDAVNAANFPAEN
jgi:invasion protein IalB